jgi:hypothetical protein
VNDYAPCRRMWCGPCYTSSLEVTFHVRASGYESEQGSGDNRDTDRLASAWGTKHQSPEAFLRGRNGDHLMVPFECDLCVFRKLTGRSCPALNNPQDRILQACIRRVLLDSFWSRASSTVIGNASRVALGLNLSELVGIPAPYLQQGPLPGFDHCGYGVAIQMVLHSRRPGKHSPTHTQFETIR